MSTDPFLETVQKLPGCSEVTRIKPLAGDASTRRYYRTIKANGQTMVIMRTGREAVELFTRTTALFQNLGVETPKIIGADGGAMALEDCGDTLLQSMLKDDHRYATPIFEKIIDSLIAFQLAARETPDKNDPAFTISFDVEKLTFETDFTLTHFIEGLLKARLDDSEKTILDDIWRQINSELAKEQETLCHRDFHSRNILIHNSRFVWIDYQDARMGRLTYDVASLALDPYLDLEWKIRQKIIDYYFVKAARKSLIPNDRKSFDQLFYSSGAQRLYKALGTYGYQTTVKKNDVYLPYIPVAAKLLLFIMAKDENLTPLSEFLEPYLKKAL